MTQQREVTPLEKKQFFAFWTNQRHAIQGRLSENTMQWFCVYTACNNVGYDFGQLRPGKNGQWDLYHWLTDPEIGCNKNEALIASGLSATEVAEEERREKLRDCCVNPDNPMEVAQFERIQWMSPVELDAEIVRLEKLLAVSEARPS